MVISVIDLRFKAYLETGDCRTSTRKIDMESVDMAHTRGPKKDGKMKSTIVDDIVNWTNNTSVPMNRSELPGQREIIRCPRCEKAMQKSGQKADSNGVVKQRFICPSCKRAGLAPYNYFQRVEGL